VNRIRPLVAAPIATALAAASLVGVASTASAADAVQVTGKPDQLCTDPPKDWYVVAPLSTNSIMLTTTPNDNNGVTCAYTAGSGRKSIKPGQTSNWSSSSPQGVSSEYKCYGDDGKNITYANSYVGTLATGYTYNVQPTNWNTKTKHWGGAILWSTGASAKPSTSVASSQYVKSCNGDDGVINAARMYPVSMTLTGYNGGTIGVATNYTLAVSASYGGTGPVTGQVALMLSKDNSNLTPADDVLLGGGQLVNGSLTVTTAFVTGTQDAPVPVAPGNYYLFGAFPGTASQTPAIPSSGWFKMATKTMPLTVSATVAPSGLRALPTSQTIPSATPAVTRERHFTGVMGSSIVEASAPRGGRMSIICPAGGVPTQININSSDPDVGIESVKRERVGDRLRLVVDAPPGASTQIQAICRKAGAPLDRDANLTYGSAGADDIRRSGERSAVYAGMGADVIVLTGRGSVGDGGLGDDDITVSAKDAVGIGGFGRDVLRSTTSERSLIIGGPGRDRLIGGPGPTIINAQDGRGGDVVTCTSPKNKVYRDKGDILIGPCTIL
jgi:hypothetical protein